MRHTFTAAPSPKASKAFRRGLLLLTLGTACTGPQLHIQNPGEHEVYVDGNRSGQGTIAFRYYGTTRWDMLPVIPEENGIPRFQYQQRSELVEVPAPSSPWLFPLDFPLEILNRIWSGKADQFVTIAAPEKPPEQRIDQQIPREDIAKLSARALAARNQR